jgi:formylglycine-generating enzyme required for sulfatase activity
MFKRFVSSTGYQTNAEKGGGTSVYNSDAKDQEGVAGADWKHPHGPTSSLNGLEDHPVVVVSWNDAAAYCKWSGKRLPTEAEWEKAARGMDERTYPWGNQTPVGTLLNFADKNINLDGANKSVDDGYQFTSPVGHFPDGASPYGVLDMAGNVRQWVADYYDKYYYYVSPDKNPGGPSPVAIRVVRGSSWATNALTSASRDGTWTSDSSVDDIGFRCASSYRMGEPTPTATVAPTPTPSPTIRVSTQVSPNDGMKMVYVPQGTFQMGITDAQQLIPWQMCLKYVTKPRDCRDMFGIDPENRKEPAHKVDLDAFWIDETDVTNAMYAKCVGAETCLPPHDIKSATRPDYYSNGLYADYPVVNVDWNQAKVYCEWAGRKLPTEAQWEKAALSTDGRTFPWGEGIDCQKANFDYYKGTGKGCVGDTTKVGSYPSGASPYGALDMAGNVWQWVADWFDETYYANSPNKNPGGPTSGRYRVIRGGSWSAFDFQLSWPENGSTIYGSNDTGFRCAASATPPN